MALTDTEIAQNMGWSSSPVDASLTRSIEAAAIAPLLARIAELERHNKALVERREFDVRDIVEATNKLVEIEHRCEALTAQVEQADPMCRVAKSKLADLIAQGYRECGVMIERTDGEGTVQRGAVSNGGMVIWWHTPQLKEPQQVEQAAQPVAWINHPTKCDNAGNFAGHGRPVLSFYRGSYGFDWNKSQPLYTAPPKAVPLTDAQEHETDGDSCWCDPDTAYEDPETGAKVIVHRRPQ